MSTPAQTPKTDAATSADASVLNGVKTTAARPCRKPAAKAAPKANGKAAPAKAAPKAATPRKALMPKERAAKPVTATIADYVAWLEKNVTGRLTAEQKHLAGISITLYGSYQVSPERRAARTSK